MCTNKILKSVGYEQNLTYEYARLAIGYASVVVAGLVYWKERRLGFNQAFNEIALGVAAYGILTLLFYGWVVFIEQNAVYIGKKKGISVRLSTKKDYENYEITVVKTDASGREIDNRTVKGKFNEWFDYHGYIVYSKFEKWLTGVVESELKKEQ